MTDDNGVLAFGRTIALGPHVDRLRPCPGARIGRICHRGIEGQHEGREEVDAVGGDLDGFPAAQGVGIRGGGRGHGHVDNRRRRRRGNPKLQGIGILNRTAWAILDDRGCTVAFRYHKGTGSTSGDVQRQPRSKHTVVGRIVTGQAVVDVSTGPLDIVGDDVAGHVAANADRIAS